MNFLEIIAIFCFVIRTYNCQSNQEFQNIFLCNYTDSACLTQIINHNYNIILNNPEVAYPFPPLVIESVEASSPCLTYNLTNVSVSGLENCTFENGRSTSDKLSFGFEFYSPKLVLTGEYALNGSILNLDVQGQGNFTITAGQYNVSFKDFHQKIVRGNETNLQVAGFYILSIDAIDPLTYNFENLTTTDLYYSCDPNNYFNENSKQVAFLVPDPLWYSILSRILANFNQYLATLFTNNEYFEN